MVWDAEDGLNVEPDQCCNLSFLIGRGSRVALRTGRYLEEKCCGWGRDEGRVE